MSMTIMQRLILSHFWNPRKLQYKVLTPSNTQQVKNVQLSPLCTHKSQTKLNMHDPFYMYSIHKISN